jgi:mRNA-degrading endonuclease toxin of MazEF toxin-antitoxin module
MCLTIPLTSNLDRLSLPYTSLINRTATTSLTTDSVALVFQLRAIANARIIGNEIGTLDDQQVGKIKTILKDMLAL